MSLVKRSNYSTKLIFDVVEPPKVTKSIWEFIKHPFVWDSYLVFKIILPKLYGASFISKKLMDEFGKKVHSSVLIPSMMSKCIVLKKNINIVERLRISYLGALIEKDYPDLLFQLMSELHSKNVSFTLTIAGKYKQNSVGRFWEDKFRKSLFNSNIEFVESPTENSKNLLFENSDFLVLFRKPDELQEYTFPTRITELLGFGKVIVTNPVGDITNYFRDSVNCVLINELDLGKAVEQFYWAAKEENYLQMISNTVKLQQEEFSPVRNAQKILSI